VVTTQLQMSCSASAKDSNCSKAWDVSTAAETHEHHCCRQMPDNTSSADEHLLNDPVFGGAQPAGGSP